MSENESDAVKALDLALEQLRLAARNFAIEDLSHENVLAPLYEAHKIVKTVARVVRGQA